MFFVIFFFWVIPHGPMVQTQSTTTTLGTERASHSRFQEGFPTTLNMYHGNSPPPKDLSPQTGNYHSSKVLVHTYTQKKKSTESKQSKTFTLFPTNHRMDKYQYEEDRLDWTVQSKAERSILMIRNVNH